MYRSKLNMLNKMTKKVLVFMVRAFD